MSKDYNHETGYESLQKEWEVHLKRTPRGVSLAKKKSGIYLQFKTPSQPRKPYACACKFTIDGMHEAVRKAHLVKAKLTNLTSEVAFWKWYKKEIQEESQLVDDQRTFIQAIIEVKRDFWNRPSRTKRERDKNNPSDQSSWYRTYGCFYKHLPEYKKFNLADIQKVIDMQKKGTRNYGYVVSAMKKLCEVIRRNDIYEELEKLDTTQTVFMELQNVDIKSFLDWRDKVLGITKSLNKRCNLESRKAWMWVFSTQIVYALRISEVFAIKNLFEPYITKDGVTIPALNDPNNTDNLIYIGEKTLLGTTVKTGSRIARPQVPPKYPDLIDRLEIKKCLLPNNKPKSKNFDSIRRFYATTSRQRLIEWDAPFTQTHADRHLGNINGMQAGIPLEVRSMSLGHTPAQNDSGYKKRISTQTKIDLLLNSNSNAIDFVTALAEAKKLVALDESKREFTAQLLSIIYQKNQKEIIELL